MKKVIKNGAFVILIATFIFFLLEVPAQAKTGTWVSKGDDYRYRVNNTYVKNRIIKVGKRFYYLNKKGIRKTGWKKYKGGKYYFDKKKGYAYTGKRKIDNKYYIFGKDGKLITDKGFYTLNKKKYYITAQGSLAVGMLHRKGKYYFFRKNGQLANKKGLYTLYGKKYYVKKGYVKFGWIKIGNVKRHFNKRYGYMDTGLTQINGKKYYFSKTGKPISGFININEKKYYFDKHGCMVSNGYINVSGYRYYAGENGELKKNCWYAGSYFDNKGRMVTDSITYDSSIQGLVTKQMLDDLNLSGYSKLMIVAHPDDETLWGGAHLSQGGYFVVCLTNSYNEVRKKEFEDIMKASNNVGLMLSYPDLVDGRRSEWTLERRQAAKDIDLILQYKHWSTVVTHNPRGEYGHIHHMLTSQIVTEYYYKNYYTNSLYYFGKYYSSRNLPKVQATLKRVPQVNVDKKVELLKLYTSQQHIVDEHIHLAPYENWIRADEW